MNSTNFIIDNTTMNMLSAFIPSGECWGEYSTIILGILLFISEAMPFIKAKSKCNEVADEEQRARYIKRHTNTRENHNDYKSAGSLSRYILWGSSTSRSANISAYKKRFGLS